ncbi:MAG: phosphatidylglycerophosphatase A [candidate division Zixibacteria bacterium]|nr:phosphatidylglycerophosphatase A [candidate division Zixibacteria bacterium]
MKQHLVRFTATGAFSGYLRPYSGTWGTIPAWLIAYYLVRGDNLILIAIAVATFLVSVWSSDEAEQIFGHDAKRIVIDEWAGMFVTLLFVPFSLTNYIIAFVAFRGFDVVKLWPAARFEKLPGGWGVTMDDIAAGVHANLFTQGVIWLLGSGLI